MTKQDQTKLLDSFLTAMRDHLMGKVAAMPDYWDGIELRRYCADEFAREVHKMPRARELAYKRSMAEL